MSELSSSYPLRRSAYTYGDNVIPSRFDFAKERFEGPFTTEHVEDVKILLSIFWILLALGPLHVLQIPASSIVFPLFGLHTGYYVNNSDIYRQIINTVVGRYFSYTATVWYD